MIERALLTHVPADQPASLERDVLPALLQAGCPIGALTCTDPFYDIGTPHDLESFVCQYAQIKERRRAG